MKGFQNISNKTFCQLSQLIMKVFAIFIFSLGLTNCSEKGKNTIPEKTNETTLKEESRYEEYIEDPYSYDNNPDLYLSKSRPVKEFFIIKDKADILDEDYITVREERYGSLIYIYDYDETEEYCKIANTSKVRYIKKEYIADEISIPLTDEELNYGLSFDYLPDSDKITVKLISKKEFESKQKSVFKQNIDSTGYSKKDGILILKTNKGDKIFEDDKGDGPKTYFEFYDEVKSMNFYVILVICQPCEEYSWLLIDKITGEQKADLDGEPYFSSDGKWIITVKENRAYGRDDVAINYSDFSKIAFYRVKNDSVVAIAEKEFPKWIKGRYVDGFISENKWLYLGVLPSFANREGRGIEEDETDYNYRYIKIRFEN